jgi:hypothetical protein
VRTVALANQTRFTLVLNLPYDLVPEMCSRGIVGTRDHDPASGERAVRVHKKRISGSVTLQPKGVEGDIARGLPESVLRAPDVDRALKMWPPKLAAKTLSKDERAAEEKALAELAEKDAKAAKTSAELVAKKAAKRAKIAANPPAPTFEEPAPAGAVTTTPAERVARGAGRRE